ncbi:MAG: hypothetical protein R6X09_00690 [Bacteroidales bacterium]
MKEIKPISIIVLIAGIMIVLTGIMHMAATPAMYRQLQSDPMFGEQMSVQKLRGMVYFFMVCGLYFVFAGSLLVFCSAQFKKKEPWSWIIATLSAFMITLAALPGLLYAKFSNPLIYIDVICGLICLLALVVSARLFHWQGRLTN